MLNPSTGVNAGGTDVYVVGDHFLNTTAAACRFGTIIVAAKFVSDQTMLCTSPPNPSGTVPVEVTSNGHDFSFSGAWFTYYPPVNVVSLWPLMGSASEGGTVVTVHGEGFENTGELSCNFGNVLGIKATWFSSTKLLCETPRHRPGIVRVQVTNNGVDVSSTSGEFLYINDISVQDVRPTGVLEAGQVPVFVSGSNFMNTTTLACRFGAVTVRGSFINPGLVACMVPSHSAQPRLQRKLGHFAVEVSVNGIDYTDSGRAIEYVQDSAPGHYMYNRMPSMSPNGTRCTGGGNSNFTMCDPGSFQPSSGADGCLSCPVGFICPGAFCLQIPMLKTSLFALVPTIFVGGTLIR